MKILTRKQQKMLIDLLSANQIILNAYNSLEGFDQIQAFSQFCENSADAICIVGGAKAINEVKEYVFFNDTYTRSRN